MSVPSNTVRKSNPVIPCSQSIYEFDTTQRAPLGTRLEMSDRVFYYGFAAASVPVGAVLCATQPVASAQSGLLKMAATSAGIKLLTMTNSANVIANLYAEGWWGVSTGTNGGETYRIRSNAAGSTGVALTLYDGLNTAITSGTNFFLLRNEYAACEVGSAGLGYVVGVPVCNVTASSYFWMQTWGPAAPNHVAATPAAAVLHLGTTGGIGTTFDATTNGGVAGVAFQIGKNIGLAATAGQMNPVYLTIKP